MLPGARANRFYMAFQLHARIGVDLDLGPLAGAHVVQVGFLEIRLDPRPAERHHGEQWRRRLDLFAALDAEVHDHAIDRGTYPADLLRQLAAAGAMSAHLAAPAGVGDYGLAIRAMAEASRVCGATGFMMWCQAVCGLYLEQSGNPALTGDALMQMASGQRLGGTALSNPMKSYAQIESLLLKATPVEGGYLVNGTLPWVSNLGPDHYFGAIASVQVDGACAGREMMFMLRCDAPGVTLKTCPEFSGMEGTGTYSVHCKDLFVGSDDVVADPAKPYIARIRGGFVLLQCGIAAGIVQGKPHLTTQPIDCPGKTLSWP